MKALSLTQSRASDVKNLTNKAKCGIYRVMVNIMEEKKLIMRAEVTGEATPEEKAAIVRTLEIAGLDVFVKENALFIRVIKDDRSRHLSS